MKQICICQNSGPPPLVLTARRLDGPHKVFAASVVFLLFFFSGPVFIFRALSPFACQAANTYANPVIGNARKMNVYRRNLSRSFVMKVLERRNLPIRYQAAFLP